MVEEAHETAAPWPFGWPGCRADRFLAFIWAKGRLRPVVAAADLANFRSLLLAWRRFLCLRGSVRNHFFRRVAIPGAAFVGQPSLTGAYLIQKTPSSISSRQFWRDSRHRNSRPLLALVLVEICVYAAAFVLFPIDRASFFFNCVTVLRGRGNSVCSSSEGPVADF